MANPFCQHDCLLTKNLLGYGEAPLSSGRHAFAAGIRPAFELGGCNDYIATFVLDTRNPPLLFCGNAINSNTEVNARMRANEGHLANVPVVGLLHLDLSYAVHFGRTPTESAGYTNRPKPLFPNGEVH